MIFNKHSELEGKHAFLSPSKYHWLNYDEETLKKRYISSYAEQMGTVLHELACKMIDNRIRMSKNDTHLVLLYLVDHGIPRNIVDMDRIYTNLMTYINDGIGYRMSPEVILKYSDVCFGTTDAISYDDANKFLRIHDLKTGTSTASIKQLEIYMAIFCLEYGIDPTKIDSELRIYQSEEILMAKPNPSDILSHMDTIKTYSSILENYRKGGVVL